MFWFKPSPVFITTYDITIDIDSLFGNPTEYPQRASAVHLNTGQVPRDVTGRRLDLNCYENQPSSQPRISGNC